MINFDFLESDNSKIEFINSIGNLIKNGEISPESLNECLGNYFATTRYILTLYESVSLEDDNLKLQYECWYAEKFQESKLKLNEGVTAKTKFASATEIQQDVIVSNMEEYQSWKNKLILSEKRKSFYFRLMESWKSNSQAIIQISQNMRTELMSLKTQDKANKEIDSEMTMRKIKKVKLYD